MNLENYKKQFKHCGKCALHKIIRGSLCPSLKQCLIFNRKLWDKLTDDEKEQLNYSPKENIIFFKVK
jgi:hypothetical protein